MVALIALAAFAAQAFRAAEKTVVSWKVDAAPAVGTAFQVQNGTEDVLQVAFGAMDPSKDDKDATTYITGDANVSITYGEQTFSFDKYASTSKTNGNNSASLAADGSSIGNYMAFTPKYDGKLIIVVQNQGAKTTCLYEDGVQKGGTLIGSGDANVDFNGAEDLKPLNNATNYSGGILVEVKAGSLYTISVAGSKGRWMGVIYEYEATPHEHNYVPDYNQYVEPTCTVDGKIVFVCECGASYEDIIPALGHDFDENGKCSRCGYTQGSGEPQGDQWVKTTSIAVDDVILLTSEGSTSSTTWCKELSEFSGNVGQAADYTETPAGLQPLTVEAGSAEGTFAFKNAEGKYLAANSSNQLPIVDALGDNSSWTVTWESDVPTIANVGTPARKLQYNSGSPRFACYTTTQKPVTIWKKVAGPTPKPVLPGEVVWSSETPQIINWSEEDQRIIIAPERFANAKVGDIVHVSVENPIINEENEWAGQVSLMSGNWKELEKTKPIASGTVTDAAYTLTGDMVKALKATGMIVFGAGYSTSLVTLESCGDDPLASDESVWFGDATLTWTQVQVYYSHFVNIDVKAGDIIKLTYEATGSPNIQLVYGWSEGQNYGAVTYGDGFATLEVTADKVETLKSKGLTVNADGIRLTLIEVVAPSGPEVIDLTLVLTDQPYDIGATVAAAKEEVLATGNLVGNITVKLSSEFAYTTTASIEAPGSVSIFGDGATIDASALTGPFIQMSTTPVVAPVLAEDGVTVKCYPIDGIELQDLTITGLPYQLLYANETRYLMDHVAVGNCVIGINGKAKKTIFDFNRGGNVAELIVDHSTLWANPSNALNGGFFSSQAGQGAIQDLGSDRQITAIQSSTIYNIACGRTFSSKRRNSTNGMEYKVKNSLIVNSGKKGEFVVGLNGGAYKNNLTWNIEGNAFNFDNGDTSELEIAKVGNDEGGNPIVKDCVAGVADFTNADGGDFNGTFILPAGGTAPETMPGDPRWTLTAVASYTITIADDMVNGTVTSDRAYASEGATVTLTAIPDAGFMLDAYSVTCNTSNEAVVVTDVNTFVMPADDVTVSATFVKAPIAIVVNAEDITDGDITAAVNAKKTAVTDAGDAVGDITINLDGNSSYTVSGSIEAPASLTFKGNGATIDASGLESPLVTTPEGNLEKWMVGNMFINRMTVKGLKKSIYASRGKNYLYKNFSVSNCFIEMAATDGFEFDFRKGGVAEQFTMFNSTIYAPTPTKNSLYTSQNGQKAIEAPGVTTQKFSISQCTLYNLAKGKNFFTHRQSGQTWLNYTLTSSIFVNCGKKGQVVKGMNQGQASPNPSWHVSGNVFNFDGADTSAEESTGDDAEPMENNIAGFIEFADAENGDFNGIFALAPAAEEPQTAPRRADSETVPMLNCGDPRWNVVAGESYDIDVQENIENGTVTADKTYAANGMTVTLTVTPAEGYELDVLVVQAFIGTDIIDIPVNEDNTFTMPAGDVFIAASFKVATGIANVAGDKYADGEWYTVGGVRIDKPTKKGLYIHNGKKVVLK